MNDELDRYLYDFGSRLAAAGAGSRLRGRLRRPLVLIAGALIGTGVALAATGAWHPILGDDHRGHPSVAHTPVPGDQTAALAVLRRPQTDADRSPQVLAVLKLLSRVEISGIHTDGIRLLRRGPDGVTILVPAERVGPMDPRYRRSVQHRVLCLLTSTREIPHTFQLHDGRTVRMPGGLVAGQTCGGLSELRTTGIASSTGTPKGFVLSGLVPDGVATVVVRLRHHRYLRARVRNNLYRVNTGKELAPGWGVTWLDASGARIEHRRSVVAGR